MGLLFTFWLTPLFISIIYYMHDFHFLATLQISSGPFCRERDFGAFSIWPAYGHFGVLNT